jgi:rod shape-determining protein MreC
VSKNISKSLIYLILGLVPFYFFFVRTESFSGLRFTTAAILAGPLSIVKGIAFEGKKLLYFHRTFDEYMRLRHEVGVLKGRLIGTEEIIRENERLNSLLRMKRKSIYSSVAANVVGRDPSNWNATLILDKGSADGVDIGDAVVYSAGVVGKIVDTGEDMSKVMLLTDPQFSVAAHILRPQETALVSGSLQSACRLSYIDEDADIRIGDEVVTSKLSSNFPENLFIGVVTSVAQQAGGKLTAIVNPAVDISQVQEVLVIKKE